MAWVSRQDGDFAVQQAQVVGAAAVEAFALAHDEPAHGLLLDVVKGLADGEVGDGFLAMFFLELGANFVGDGAAGAFAGEFAGGEQRGHHAVAGQGLGFVEDFVGDDVEGDRTLGLAGLGDEVLLGCDERLAAVVGAAERGIEVGFGDFLRGAFDHDDVGFAADVDEIEVALGALSVSGVGHEGAVDTAHAHGAEGTVPRDVADGKGGAGAENREDVGVVFLIGAQEDGLDLDFVEPAFGKERPDRAVGEAAGEDFLFGGPAFALEVAAGELAGRRGALAVIDLERKEILSFLGFDGADGGGNDDGFAELDGDGAVGLLGDPACFDGDLFVADLGGDFFRHDIGAPPASEELQ